MDEIVERRQTGGKWYVEGKTVEISFLDERFQFNWEVAIELSTGLLVGDAIGLEENGEAVAEAIKIGLYQNRPRRSSSWETDRTSCWRTPSAGWPSGGFRSPFSSPRTPRRSASTRFRPPSSSSRRGSRTRKSRDGPSGRSLWKFSRPCCRRTFKRPTASPSRSRNGKRVRPDPPRLSRLSPSRRRLHRPPIPRRSEPSVCSSRRTRSPASS